MTYEEILNEQKRLDEKLVKCPNCSKQSRWWELRNFKTCFDCYARYTEEEDEELNIR